MQRDRTSKYLWSVRGFLPGRQRLRCSFANVHSQGARWLIRSSRIRTMKMARLRRLTFRFAARCVARSGERNALGKNRRLGHKLSTPSDDWLKESIVNALYLLKTNADHKPN